MRFSYLDGGRVWWALKTPKHSSSGSSIALLINIRYKAARRAFTLAPDARERDMRPLIQKGFNIRLSEEGKRSRAKKLYSPRS